MRALLSEKINDKFSLNIKTTDEPIIEDDEEIEEIQEEQDGGGEKIEPPRILIDYSNYGIIFI